MLSWIDGIAADAVAASDRGLAYGDGLFETISVAHGKPSLLERHMSRLALSCERLQFPLDSLIVRSEILAFSALLGDGVAKLIITRGQGMRGYASPQPCVPRRILIGSPRPSYPAANAEQGVSLFSCQTRLAEQPLLAGMKHLNRLEQVLARSEWQDPAYAEGLMQDYSGRLIEGVYSNLILVQKGQLHTPDLSRCGVAGVMRSELLAQATAQGIDCYVRDIARLELHGVDEVLLCNSLYGVWPVTRIAEHRWSVGLLTRKLQSIACDLLDN